MLEVILMAIFTTMATIVLGLVIDLWVFEDFSVVCSLLRELLPKQTL